MKNKRNQNNPLGKTWDEIEKSRKSTTELDKMHWDKTEALHEFGQYDHQQYREYFEQNAKLAIGCKVGEMIDKR